MSSHPGWTVLCAGLLLASCGGEATAPADGIPASSLTGTWTLTLGDSLPCPDSVAARTFSITVTGSEDDVEPGGSLTWAADWTAGTLTGQVFGTINVRNRSVVLHLVRQDTLAYGLEVRGALDDDLVFEGRASDPYRGYLPLLVASQCTFNAEASRTSP